MKIGKDKLKMSDGNVRQFGSATKRNNFERVAQAVKHGFKPAGRGKNDHDGDEGSAPRKSVVHHSWPNKNGSRGD